MFLNPNWHNILDEEFKKDYFQNLKEKLHKNNFFPPPDKIFSFAKYFSLEETKVVILGQDPYHNVNQANGLSFSVANTEKIPPSLQNIFKEIKSNYEDFQIPQNGCLENWAKQKVLLLNATLTVEAHKPNSHSDLGWEKITDLIISEIDKKCKNVVFLLWDKFAEKKEKLIKNKTHLILKSAHPSPFSVRRGFFGNKHFLKTNEFLNQNKKTEIIW